MKANSLFNCICGRPIMLRWMLEGLGSILVICRVSKQCQTWCFPIAIVRGKQRGVWRGWEIPNSGPAHPIYVLATYDSFYIKCKIGGWYLFIVKAHAALISWKKNWCMCLIMWTEAVVLKHLSLSLSLSLICGWW